MYLYHSLTHVKGQSLLHTIDVCIRIHLYVYLYLSFTSTHAYVRMFLHELSDPTPVLQLVARLSAYWRWKVTTILISIHPRHRG